MISFAAITPHPPIIIPTIGKKKDLEKATKTINAMKKLRRAFEKSEAETLIIISPHGPLSFHKLTIFSSETLSGNLSMFGDLRTKLFFKNDKVLTKDLSEKCEKERINYRLLGEKKLDHGILVPLFYLSENKKPKIVPLVYSMLNTQINFKYGKILGSIVKKSTKKIGIIASGDLSHRLTQKAPAGYSPRGEEFDKKLIDLLGRGKTEEILNIDNNLIEEAGECGYKSIIILLGILSELKIAPKFEILSYEGPFGVGYLVASLSFAK